MKVEEVSVLRIPSTAYLAASLAGLAILAACSSSQHEAGRKVQSSEAPPVTAPPPKAPGSGTPNAPYPPRSNRKKVAGSQRPASAAGEPPPPPKPEPPPVEQAKPSAVNLTWNAWAQDPGARFVNPDHLHPDRDYELIVDLSAISYKLAGGGRSKAVGPGTDRWIQQLLKDATKEEAIFKVLILPDPAHYDHPVKRADTLSFKLDRLKDAKALLADAGDDAMAVLRARPEASFRLGHVAFPIHTTELEGVGSIGISFWADNRPID